MSRKLKNVLNTTFSSEDNYWEKVLEEFVQQVIVIFKDSIIFPENYDSKLEDFSRYNFIGKQVEDGMEFKLDIVLHCNMGAKSYLNDSLDDKLKKMRGVDWHVVKSSWMEKPTYEWPDTGLATESISYSTSAKQSGFEVNFNMHFRKENSIEVCGQVFNSKEETGT